MRENFRVLLKGSAFRYVAIGGTTVLIDVCLLVILKEVAGLNVFVAATLSFWTSLLYNFLLNKFWTFGVRNNTPHHLVLYALLIIFNYFVGIFFIAVLGNFHVTYVVAKVAALALTTVWNYILYKHVIFVPVDSQLVIKIKSLVSSWKARMESA